MTGYIIKKAHDELYLKAWDVFGESHEFTALRKDAQVFHESTFHQANSIADDVDGVLLARHESLGDR